MIKKITMSTVCTISDDIVAREIEGEIIIVPLTAGISDDDDALFTLNPTAQAIWEKIDGKRCLQDIAVLLAGEFEADRGEIEADVLGLVTELVKRKMLVEV